jgi:hypothetical protein
MGPAVRPYIDIPGLGDIVLEESYVLGIAASPGSLAIAADLVLAPGHPAYRPPPADESDCFVRGRLVFRDVRHLTWENQGAPPASDASGELDYGHIDDLRRDGDIFELEGDWGNIRVIAAGVDLELEP